MDTVNLGITFPLDRALLETIAAVSPRVNLRDLSQLVAEEDTSPEAKAKLDDELRDIEVLFIAVPPRDLMSRAPKLKWVQWIGTGIDYLYRTGIMDAPFPVTNVTGINAIGMAEHCFAFMLMFAKRMPANMEQQRARSYERDPVRPDVLEGKTLGVLGMGSIGQEVARLGKAFHMRVLAMHRSATRRSNVGQLHELLGECDFVVVALPLTQETMGIIGEAEFRTMKRTATIINVGRGREIDEEAMVRALREGRIAGAGLDVFEEEPLPTTSPLWSMPNVLITPHVSGDLIDHRVRVARFFCANLRRYLAGEPLQNVIDPARGY
jgi:phosphoglycerate dehydrogenase-like enzyme